MVINPELSLILEKMLEILIAPTKNLDVFLTLMPVYAVWVTNEILFERQTKQFYNIFWNGFTGLWVGLSWLRFLTHDFKITPVFGLEFSLSAFICIYGIWLMVQAMEGREISKLLGSTRIISFTEIYLSGIIYKFIIPNFYSIMGAVLLFTVLCTILWIIHKILPEMPGEAA